MQRKAISIIGGGASGTILTAHAVRHFHQATDIYLFEQSGDFGRGVAYGLNEPCFLLNVRANRMGTFEEQPGHFYEWMISHENLWRPLHPDFTTIVYAAEDFVPRMIYGAYLKWILADAIEVAAQHGNKVFLIPHRVKKIESEGTNLRVVYKNADSFLFDAVVFASGNSVARKIVASSEKVFSAPYENRFVNRDWKNDKHVLIAGTGLSMVDTMQLLKKREFSGKVTAISRNGLLPLSHPHTSKSAEPFLTRENFPQNISALIKMVRSALRTGVWQDKIDSLRSVSNELWRDLDSKKQKRLSRIFSWWSIARHRIPDFMYDYLMGLKEQQSLRICKGGIQSVSENKKSVEITLRNGEVINGDVLVNCAGFDYSVKNIQDLCPSVPLQIHWSGTVEPISGYKFRLSENHPVFAIGPLLYGFYFESTAVHEIRAQAKKILNEIKI